MLNCTLPNGHTSGHEVFVGFTQEGCSRPLNHIGAHRIFHQSLRETATGLDTKPKARQEDLLKLGQMVLEAMGFPVGCPQLAHKPDQHAIQSMLHAPSATGNEMYLQTMESRSLVEHKILSRAPRRTKIINSPYWTLDSRERQIRLFRLQPQHNALITGSFVRVNLESCPLYAAISYTWGDRVASRSIVLDQCGQVEVRENLWSFLDQQSLTITQPKLFWIDAVCINQSDTEERNHQVGLMNTIYVNAAEVFVCLGEDTIDSDMAMTYVANQSGRPLRQRGAGFYPLWSTAQGSALQSLFQRPYWTRIWIIQELLHAEKIQVWCGSKVLNANGL